MRKVLILLLVSTSALAQETPRTASDQLVACSVTYAKQHPSPRLTATELSEAAVTACSSAADKVRDLAYRDGLAAAQKLSAEQRNVLGEELQRTVRRGADQIRADAIQRAKGEVLRSLAESK